MKEANQGSGDEDIERILWRVSVITHHALWPAPGLAVIQIHVEQKVLYFTLR